MPRRYILPAVRQPRRNDKLSAHREEIERLRADGYSFQAIADRFGVSNVAIFFRVHRWAGRLKRDKTIDWAAVRREAA